MHIIKTGSAAVIAMAVCLAVCPALAAAAEPTAADSEPSVREISLTEAIELTLANNIDLRLVEKQVDARTLDLDRADFFSGKLRDADEKISAGWQTLRAGESQLASIKAGIDAGLITPTSPYYLTEDQIAAREEQLQAAAAALTDSAVYAIDNLANAQVAELYQTKAGLGLSVTRYGCQIAREKFALLTRQKYYAVLKCQQLAAVKRTAAARAETQAQMAADSWQAGFRAKDDMLLARARSSLMQADLIRAENDLSQAMLDLKKVLYLPLDTEILLADDFSSDMYPVDLQAGLDQALRERLEIRKAEMELTVAEINMELAKRYLTPNVFDYRQIQLDLTNAQLALVQQQQLVAGDVRAACNDYLAAAAMLAQVRDSAAQAREAAEIAAYRYQAGYGIPTAVLQSMSMEDAGGTVFEVLAAQEKLCEVEEKVVEITAACNLAWSKYRLEICSGSEDVAP